jgi:hypothetical protein
MIVIFEKPRWLAVLARLSSRALKRVASPAIRWYTGMDPSKRTA